MDVLICIQEMLKLEAVQMLTMSLFFLVNLYLGLFVQFDRTAEALTGKEGEGDTRHSTQPSELNSVVNLTR